MAIILITMEDVHPFLNSALRKQTGKEIIVAFQETDVLMEPSMPTTDANHTLLVKISIFGIVIILNAPAHLD